jgi:hypothetical protein
MKGDGTMKRKLLPAILLFLAMALTVRVSTLAAEPAGSGTAEPTEAGQRSLEEVSRQLNNPVADLWALNFQFNRYYLNGRVTDRTRDQELLNFQPVLPVHLTESWNLINRPVLPFIFNSPAFEPGKGWHDESGFGDVSLVSLLSPANLTSGLIWGVGPTFIFPTASDNTLGQGKYQAGPAAVGVYMGQEWILGALVQQWWSFAGDNGSRPGASQSNIQYFIQYLFGEHWQIGMQPNILIDWKADQGQRFTVPVGLGIGKMVKFGPLPVKFTLEGDYMVVNPDDFGQRYGIRFQIIPVLPALFKGTLF